VTEDRGRKSGDGRTWNFPIRTSLNRNKSLETRLFLVPNPNDRTLRNLEPKNRQRKYEVLKMGEDVNIGC